jgi:hypothetical protein
MRGSLRVTNLGWGRECLGGGAEIYLKEKNVSAFAWRKQGNPRTITIRIYAF